MVLLGDLAACAAESPRTPAEIQKYAEGLVADNLNKLDVTDLKLVLEWCPIACQ